MEIEIEFSTGFSTLISLSWQNIVTKESEKFRASSEKKKVKFVLDPSNLWWLWYEAQIGEWKEQKKTIKMFQLFSLSVLCYV